MRREDSNFEESLEKTAGRRRGRSSDEGTDRHLTENPGRGADRHSERRPERNPGRSPEKHSQLRETIRRQIVEELDTFFGGVPHEPTCAGAGLKESGPGSSGLYGSLHPSGQYQYKKEYKFNNHLLKQ